MIIFFINNLLGIAKSQSVFNINKKALHVWDAITCLPVKDS